MNTQHFYEAFENMRTHNLGKQFERRSLGLLALQYGVYFNSTMWACGLDKLFSVGKIGPKYVYTFKNILTNRADVEALSVKMFQYKHNTARTIEHAKSILRKFNIQNID